MALPQYDPKTTEQILQDQINMMKIIAPRVTDYNIGSVVRSILETSSWEDGTAYAKITEVLRLWNLGNLRGRLLEERLAERNISKIGALSATGLVVVSNTNLITSFNRIAASKTGLSLTLYSTESFPPTTSAPYMIRIGEGKGTVENLTVTANDIANGVLTLDVGTPLVNDHLKDERVSFVSGAGNLPISSGTQGRAPADAAFPDRTVTFLDDGEVVDGNYDSAPIRVRSDVVGVTGNIREDQITEFVGSPPFTGAAIRNDGPLSGGRDVESDLAFLARGRLLPQAMARSTPISLEQLVRGVTFEDGGQTWRILSARQREFTRANAAEDHVMLYIWPGSFNFIKTASVITATNLTSSAEEGQKFFKLPNIAITPNSLVLEKQVSGSITWDPMTPGTDYFVNEGKGEIQVVNPGLSKGDKIRFVKYDHYTGLIQEIQRVVNGVVDDPVLYPGIAPVGVKVLVSFPRPRIPDPIRYSIVAGSGFDEIQLAPLTQNAVLGYLSELAIGDDVIHARIVERVMDVEGITNMDLDNLSASDKDLILLEDEALDLDKISILPR